MSGREISGAYKKTTDTRHDQNGLKYSEELENLAGWTPRGSLLIESDKVFAPTLRKSADILTDAVPGSLAYDQQRWQAADGFDQLVSQELSIFVSKTNPELCPDVYIKKPEDPAGVDGHSVLVGGSIDNVAGILSAITGERPFFKSLIALVIGETYFVEYTIDSIDPGDSFYLDCGSDRVTATRTAPGVYRDEYTVTAGTTSTFIWTVAGGGLGVVMSRISISLKSTTDRFPAISAVYGTGTTANNFSRVKINTETGELKALDNATADDIRITDEGDFWRVYLKAKSTDGTNDFVDFEVAPAYGETWSAPNAEFTATGEAAFWGAQIFNISGDQTKTLLEDLQDNHEFYHLVEFQFSTALRYTNAPRDLTLNGSVYQSSHIIDKLPDIEETLKIRPGNISLAISAATIAANYLALYDHKNIDVLIYRYYVGSDEAFLAFRGFIDGYESIEDEETATITWKIANHWADWDSTNGLLLTDDSLDERISGDKGFQFSGITDPILRYWGKSAVNDKFGLNNDSSGYDFGALYSNLADRRPEWVGLPGWPEHTSDEYQNLSSDYDWNTSSASSLKLPVVYGSAPVSGVPVFRDISGINGDTLWVVYALSEGECTNLQDMFINDVSYTDVSLSPYITVLFHTGTDTQTVDSSLDGASIEWTSLHRLRSICYCVVKYIYNEEVFQGEPQPKFLLNGRKCAPIGGGVGAWTDSPPRILYDYLTNSRYGKGLAATDIDEESFLAGQEYCDELLSQDLTTGAFISRFEFNGVIDTKTSIKKNAEAILFNMIGHLVWVNGKYKLVIERNDDVPLYHIDSDRLKGKVTVNEPGVRSRANSVYYTFLDKAANFIESTVYTSLPQATIDAEDNGRALKKTLKNKYEWNRYRAQNRSNTILKQSRDQITCKVILHDTESVTVEAGEIIKFSRESFGWFEKLFRVTSTTLKADGDVAFTLSEYDFTNYDWNVPAFWNPPTQAKLTDVLIVPPPTSVTLTSGTVHQITATDGTTVNRIYVLIAYTIDLVFIEAYEVEYKESADITANYTKVTDLIGYNNKTCYISNVKKGINYNVRVRAVNSLGVKSAWTVATQHQVSGDETVGTKIQYLGTDAWNNTGNYFYHPTFESLSGFSTSGGQVALSTTGGIIITLSSLSIFFYKWMHRDINNTLAWTHPRSVKSRVKVTSIGMVNNDYILIGTGFVQNSASLQIKWNSSTSKFDLYAWAEDGGFISTTFIGSVNSGVDIVLTIRFFPTAIIVDVDGVGQGIVGSNIPSGVGGENVTLFVWGLISSGTNSTVEFDDWIFLQET